MCNAFIILANEARVASINCGCVMCAQFNDQLLVCQSQPIKLGLKQQYTVKASLDIAGMRVCCLFYLFAYLSVSFDCLTVCLTV